MTPSHVAAAINSLTLAKPGYDTAEQFFEGTAPEVISSRRLRRLLGDYGAQFKINFARTPVDVFTERTTIQSILATDPAVNALWEQAWADNQLGLEAKDVHRLTYEFGDGYLIGWKDEDLPSGVSLFAHDPRTVRVFYDPANPRRKSHAVHTWIEQGSDENELGEGLWFRLNLYYPDRVEQWQSRNRLDAGTPGVVDKIVSVADMDLVPYDEDVDNPTPGIVPVFHFRTGRPYGRPVHADAYGPQRMIHKASISMMAALDHAGYPQRYVTTDDALNPGAESDAFGPPPEDTYSSPTDKPGLSPDSSLESGPGATWLLSGSNIGVGQFATASTDNFLNVIHSLVEQMSAVTDVPVHYYSRKGQQPSGDSFRMAEVPLAKALSSAHDQLGVTWREVHAWMMVANGRKPVEVQVNWDPPQQYTDKESWETAGLQLTAGLPLERILAERGYPPSAIDEIVGRAPEPAPEQAPPESETAGVPGALE